MNSLKELYKIGNGPSSSHTMGVKRATIEAIKRVKDFDFVKVTLYGSLALTGKGHLTDYIIAKTLEDCKHEIIFDYMTLQEHPNTLKFEFFQNTNLIKTYIAYSVGGGAIRFKDEEVTHSLEVYKLNTFYDIKEYCNKNNLKLYEYVYQNEDIYSFLEIILDKMLECINEGLLKDGVLPGELQIPRKAKYLFNKQIENEPLELKEKRIICSYAYAVNEENASGGEVVTAPTCGASGVLPSLVRYYMEKNIYSKKQIIDALATAGIIGNLIKHNASISGAECGCQAEVGAACSMGAAFVAQIMNLSVNQIETASEIALEHHLGLTCDPIKGYVQIPCIERNAVAALRSIDAAMLASILNEGDSKISFDLVCKTMKETGLDLACGYKETSEKGLAKHYLV